MFPYLIKFPDIIGHYILSILGKLSTDQFIMLIPKIVVKLSSKDEFSKYLGVVLLDSFPIHEIRDLSLFTNVKIPELTLNILENDSFPSFKNYDPVILIRFLYNFLSYFLENQNEKILNVLFQKSRSFLDSKYLNVFILCGSMVYRILEAHVNDFKTLPGGKEFLLKMKYILEENKEEKLNLTYNLVSLIQAFGENIALENLEIMASIINPLVKQLGVQISSRNVDSIVALVSVFELMGKDIYPWFDIISTKLVNLLKKEQKSQSIQQIYIYTGISFMITHFPELMMKHIESSGFMDLILFNSLVIPFHIQI
jgi:hypothetical protein